MLKNKIKQLHKNFIKEGKYKEAKLVLELLRKGSLTLIGYDDVTFNVESKLDKILKPCYSYNCVKVNFYLNRPLEKCK